MFDTHILLRMGGGIMFCICVLNLLFPTVSSIIGGEFGVNDYI